MAETDKKPDYSTPAKRKRFVESERQRALKTAGDANTDAGSCLDGVCGDRRKKAILNYLDRAEEDFHSFGLSSVVEQFVRNEIMPVNGYDRLDSENDLRIGAALWILDRLRESGRLRDALGLLPDVSGDVEAMYLPVDFSHPCYDRQLIQAVIHLISRRYSGEPRRNGVITEQNAGGGTLCEAYEKLLELLPEEAVRSACEAFKEKQWELVTRFMKGQAYFDREIDRSVRELQKNLPFPGVMQAPFVNVKPAVRDGFGSTGGLSAADHNVLDAAVRGRKLLEQSSDYILNFDRYLQMDKAAVRREAGRQVAEALDGFRVDAPFELCFALFCLIDRGDDAPWLLHSGVSLMLYVLRMLPWQIEEETGGKDWDEEDWDQWYGGLTYDRNGWLAQEPVKEQLDYYHEKHGNRNLAQIVYDLCRTVIPTGLHPFEADRQRLVSEGMNEETARKLTDAAELLFLYEFQARQKINVAWELPTAEEKTAEPAADTDRPSAPKLGGYRGRVMGTASGDGPENRGISGYDGGLAEENEKLKAELNAAKKQLNSLRDALAATRHEAAVEITGLERELKSLRMEHRELADLRELVFNRKADFTERPEKSAKEYEYPYETKKRTVVFGGHDTFIKAIKPLLPGVRFVDAGNMTFSQDIIRNAEVVWIQNNCISHPQYWSIVRGCKQAGVQMRHFGYASAEKCAGQLIEWDRNG